MKNKMKKFLEKLSKRKYRGVSLVEALVYLAILASVFTVIFEFAIIISDANRTEEIDLDMQTNKVLIVENLEEAFISASSIDEVNSVFNTGNDILIINDETGTYSFYLVNGKLVVDNHGSINNLVSSQFWVNNYTVSPIYDHLDVISGVEVNLTYYSTRDSNKTITLQRTFTYK